ncbi:MAG: hypothetical protein ACLFVN_08170 [Phycisphaeraceae bacterium]
MERHEEHDLRENDLQEFFRHFGDFWGRWGNIITIVVALSLTGYLIYWFVTTQAAQEHEYSWRDVTYATSATGFAKVAEAHDDPAVQALAYLRGAELYTLEALGASPEPAPAEGEQEDEAEAQPTLGREEALQRATEMYERAIDVAPDPVYRANGLLGLASVAESLENWERAQQFYDQAAEVGREASLPNIVEEALDREALIERLQQPVTIAEQPAPAEADAQPAPATPEQEGDSAESLVPETGTEATDEEQPLVPPAGSEAPAGE